MNLQFLNLFVEISTVLSRNAKQCPTSGNILPFNQGVLKNVIFKEKKSYKNPANPKKPLEWCAPRETFPLMALGWGTTIPLATSKAAWKVTSLGVPPASCYSVNAWNRVLERTQQARWLSWGLKGGFCLPSLFPTKPSAPA